MQELQEPDLKKILVIPSGICVLFTAIFGSWITFYSDEAWFHLSGYVNSQNNQY